MVRWHLIEGKAGCEYAVENHSVAVIVDALRASATAAMILDAGATELLVVRTVDEALALKRETPDRLLFGERGGLPPEGFDFGNSPREAFAAKGKRIAFTTTTGAQRLIDAFGSVAVYMGTTLNASAVIAAAARHNTDVVLIPAGLEGDPTFDAQEDWVAATLLASRAGGEIGRGRERFEHWQRRIESEGVAALFYGAPHARKLRAVGLEADIDYCAQIDIVSAVPVVVERTSAGVRIGDASTAR